MQTAEKCLIEISHNVLLRTVRYDLLCPNEEASASNLQQILASAYRNAVAALHPNADLKIKVQVQASGGKYSPIQAECSSGTIDVYRLGQALREAYDRVKYSHRTWVV